MTDRIAFESAGAVRRNRADTIDTPYAPPSLNIEAAAKRTILQLKSTARMKEGLANTSEQAEAWRKLASALTEAARIVDAISELQTTKA